MANAAKERALVCRINDDGCALAGRRSPDRKAPRFKPCPFGQMAAPVPERSDDAAVTQALSLRPSIANDKPPGTFSGDAFSPYCAACEPCSRLLKPPSRDFRLSTTRGEPPPGMKCGCFPASYGSGKLSAAVNKCMRNWTRPCLPGIEGKHAQKGIPQLQCLLARTKRPLVISRWVALPGP
jgi:hypothetical protein